MLDGIETLFDYVKDIGSGSHGTVKLIKNNKTNELLALKIIDNGNDNEFDLQLQVSEHPNIAKVYYYYNCNEINLAGLIMEYAPDGDLFSLLNKKKKLCESDARLIFMQLISAVGYCHSQNICHRDIKLENILQNESIIKLTDFGYACLISESNNKNIKKRVGTMAYVSPEVLLDRNCDLIKTDIWACGVVLYLLLCGKYPFKWDKNKNINAKETQLELARNIINLNYNLPEHLSEESKDLFKNIFNAQPKNRISINEIWNCKWLNMYYF